MNQLYLWSTVYIWGDLPFYCDQCCWIEGPKINFSSYNKIKYKKKKLQFIHLSFTIWRSQVQILLPAIRSICLGWPRNQLLHALYNPGTGLPPTSWDFNKFLLLYSICLYIYSRATMETF